MIRVPQETRSLTQEDLARIPEGGLKVRVFVQPETSESRWSGPPKAHPLNGLQNGYYDAVLLPLNEGCKRSGQVPLLVIACKQEIRCIMPITSCEIPVGDSPAVQA